MGNLRISTTANISDATMVDMLDAAGYGMTGWARSMEVDVAHDRVTVVEGIDDDDLVEHTTNFATLRDAFRKLATPGQEYVGSTYYEDFASAVNERDPETGEVDAGFIDAGAGDCLVQVALFDDVRYG